MLGFALGCLTVALVVSFADMAGMHAERQRRIKVAVLRSRKVAR